MARNIVTHEDLFLDLKRRLLDYSSKNLFFPWVLKLRAAPHSWKDMDVRLSLLLTAGNDTDYWIKEDFTLWGEIKPESNYHFMLDELKRVIPGIELSLKAYKSSRLWC